MAHANDKATARFSAGLFPAEATDYPAGQKALRRISAASVFGYTFASFRSAMSKPSVNQPYELPQSSVRAVNQRGTSRKSFC
jgi:hypothetical protein